MKSTATLRYLRMAPRKVRLVADLVRGKKVEEAQTMLRFVPKRAAEPMLKILHSAVASSESEESNLYIAKVTIDEGPKLKRYRARARGAAYPIQKKTSHVTIVLEEIEKGLPAGGQEKTSKAKPALGAAKEESKKEDKTMKPAVVRQRADSGVARQETPKFRPEKAREIMKPKREGGLRRFFRRKAI